MENMVLPKNGIDSIESLQREIENLNEEEKRTLIMDKLYSIIEPIEPLLAPKITGMIIYKQSTDKLCKLLTDPNHKRLNDKITEATKMLTASAITGGGYYSLYHEISRCNNTAEKIIYLRSKLYPNVEQYVFQKNLADIITEMLLQLDISELFVLLNQKNTLKGRMDEAIKAYLEINKIPNNANYVIN